MAAILAYEFEAEGVVVKVYAEDVPDGIKFTFDTTLDPGYFIDLNGFFVDLNGDGGPIFSLGGGNNMNGGNNDGYDVAFPLGSVGGNDADFTNGYIIWTTTYTVADLEGSDAGLRATSYGLDREGSLKLVDGFDGYEPPPSDYFPEWPQDISNIVLYFQQSAGDVKGGSGRGGNGADGYYTVKIDDVPDAAPDDLDTWIDDLLGWLVANDPYINEDSLDSFLGVSIKGGLQETQFFAYGAYDSNGNMPDPYPNPPGVAIEGNKIDKSYDYESIFPPIA